jgi:Acetyltransferase (GNAT) domain
MLPPLKPGVRLAQPNGPVIDTERLKLRQWCGADVAPNAAMLSDPGTARFIAADGKPPTSELMGWRNAAVMAGHWALPGAGMFVVEEKSSGKFVGRVGPWFPPGWPGFEVGWGIAREFRGKGYALEAAPGVDRLVVCNLRARSNPALHRLREYPVPGGGPAPWRRKAGRDGPVWPCRGCMGDPARQVEKPVGGVN